MDGTPQYDAFSVKFDPSHAAIGADIMRVEADGKRKRVEPQCAARPCGIDPACWCLTPHGFGLPAGIMFPVDALDLARTGSETA
jgi:hypothetical protein